MRIAVDGQLLAGNRTGMGVYAFNILRYWTSDDDIIIYVPGRPPEDLKKISDEKGFIIRTLDICNYFKWEQVILPKAVKKDGVDILWCPYCTAPFFPPCPISVVLHDTIYMEVKLKSAPTLYKKMGLIYRRMTAPVAAKRAISVATVSKYSKGQVCKYFPVARGKIEIVPNGVDSTEGLSLSEKSDFFLKNKINGEYILGFGSLEARKNSISLIKAYEQLSDEIKAKYKLVLFGFRGYEESADRKYIENHKLSESIIPLGYISDKEKKTLYDNCSVFVFPSLSEGFGIPILEAFDSQTPVVTSNVTSLPEVAGDGAVLVEPTDIFAIAKGITKILEEADFSNKLILDGKKQLDRYTWKSASEKMQRLIHSKE